MYVKPIVSELPFVAPKSKSSRTGQVPAIIEIDGDTFHVGSATDEEKSNEKGQKQQPRKESEEPAPAPTKVDFSA